MKNLLNNLLNWVLKKGPSETKKDQAWEEKEQAGSKKDQVKRTKLSEKDQVKGNKLGEKGTSLEMNPCVMGSEAREVMGSEVREVMGSEAREVRGSEAVSANHALITQLSRNNHPISLRAIRYAAVLFMVLMVGVGQTWGASPLTVETPNAPYYTQDGVTVFGENTTGKMKNSSSQKCYNTNNASVIVFSELTNITGISFDMCLAGDGSGEGNAISLYTSTGGVFAVPSSGFTATKGGSTLGSLTNIQAIKANQSSLTSISVTFDSPVKGIELKKAASTNIRNIVVTYNNTTLPSVYFKATTTSTADVANVETTPSGGSMTVDTKTTKKTINSIDYYQAESGSQTINLGTGNTFQAGDQIVLEFCGSGNNKTVGPIIQKTTNCTISVTVNDKVPAKVAYIVSAGDGIQGQTSATIIRTSSDLYIRSFSVLRAAAACTAPSSVGITGTNKYLAGQDINLTATPTGHTGTPTYQWQKEINSVWTNVTNGDNISGATTNNLQITGCDHYNSGQYRCVVSTGSESCTTNSDAFGVHVFTVYGGYVGDTWSDSEIQFSAGTSGTATVHLNAGSLYKFHIRSNNGAYYCNGEADYNGDGNADGGSTDGWYTLGSFSNWSFGRSSRNFRIYTGAEGDYTITVDIANALVSGDYVTVSVTYPTPTHPSEGYAYFEKPNNWDGVKLYWYTDDNSRLTSWDGSPEITATTTICGTTYYYTPLGTTFSNVIFRDKGSNQWTSLATSGFSGKYLDKTTPASPAWASFSTYTITYAANGGGGSMSATSGICPDADLAITSNAFTAPTGCASFAHWTANVAVKVGDATVAAGNPIANGATIQDIKSDITLTAVWKLAAPTITDKGDNTFSISGSMAGSSYYYTTNGSTPTTSSSLYSAAVDFSAGAANITAQAIAHKDGYVDSDVASQACTYHAADPCSEPTEVANEIARFFVPCGTGIIKYEVTNQAASTGDNTFTTYKVGSASTDNWYTDETTGYKYGKLTASDSYISLKLSAGSFQAGDVVNLYVNCNNATKTGLKLKNQSTGNTVSVSSTAAKVEASGTYTLVAADIEADGSIKFFRENSSTFVNRIIITRPACTNVSITTQPTTPVAATVGSACSITGLVAAGTSPTYQWYTCNSDGSGATAITSADAMSFTGYTSATLGLTPTAAGATYYKCVVSGTCGDPVTSSVVTVNASAAPVGQTALVANTLYEVPDMIPSGASLTTGDQFFEGLSANTKFELIGSASNSKTPKVNNNSDNDKTIDGITFDDGSMWFKGVAELSSNIPTTFGLSFIVPEGGGKLYLYFSTATTNIKLAKAGSAGSTPTLTDGYAAEDVTAGTYYLYGTGTTSPYCFYGLKLCSKYNVSISTTNVTKTDGATGAGAAIHGRAYTATFTAPVGYTLPSDVTSLTIGGVAQTKGTGYTWTISDGTATLTVPAAYVTDDIAVSVAGAAASTYSITYDCDGAESGCPSNVAAAYTLPSPLPSAPTKDGYDFVGWYTNSTKTVAAVAGAALSENTTLYAKWTEHIASECITITDFETSNHSKSDNKPDSEGKYFYGYKGTKDAAHAVTITATNGDCIGVNSGAELKVYAGKYVNIYADNTTTGGTPATFSNVTSVSIDAKMINSSYYTTFDIKVGETTIADDVSLVDAKSSYQTFTYDGLAQLSGKIKIINNGSGSSYNFYADNIQICTADMDACTTPTIPDLSNQSLCSGAAAAAWNATVSNAATIEAAGESVAYKWQKKNGSNWDDISGATTATYDVDGSGTVTEAMEGTYRVVVTVSKAGKSSTTANKEVTLTVTPATEVTAITADKATVYPTNSVTLTATANMDATWQWYTCTNAEGAGESSIGGATDASYTIASAGAAGTYYYKAKATGSCGTAEYVYTLTVSAAAGGDCETEIWVVKAADLPEGATAATHITTPFTGGSNETASITIDGNTYTITQRTSNATGPATIVVPEGNTATLYILVKGNSGRSVILEKGGVQQWTATPDDGWQSLSVGNLAAGTYSLRSSNNLGWGLLALKLCSAVACSDPEVTASADNSTICVGGSVTFTAANAHASATYQWQKYSGSAWTNISGAESATYTINPVAAGDETKYRVIASNDCSRTSNEVTLTVASTPVFGAITSPRTVMETQALSINDVEASDATTYRWYKSANNTYEQGTDAEVGTAKNLTLASGGETSGATYYLFCIASNSCGSVTSSAIRVNVTTLVEEDCATKGNEGSADFGFENTGCSQGTYSETAVWTTNSRSKYLTYTAPDGKYLKTAKVTVAVSSGSKCGYAYSTNSGSTWTYAELSSLSSTLTEKTIDLSGSNVTDFRISRNLQDGGGTDHGVTSGNFYLSKACFEYNESCTATEVARTAGNASYDYTYGSDFTKPTFALQKASDHSALAGTLNYSSSNENVASVDDNGDIDFTGVVGSVTITVAFAGGTISKVEYCASQATYTINVTCSDVQPKITTTGDNISCQSSITLNAVQQNGSAFADGSFQWYRDGEAIDGATSASYIATRAGLYTVSRTATCTKMSSNSANITNTNIEPEVERLTPFQYYHVDSVYRATSIMRYRHLFAVKGSTEYNSTGKNFKMELSRNGGEAVDVTTQTSIVVTHSADNTVDTVLLDLNALNGKYNEGDELVLTCKAVTCGGSVSDTYKESIEIHVINKNTPTLALICSGAEGDGTRTTSKMKVGGDFLTGYNKADLCQQTGKTAFDKNTEWGLYTKLKEHYIVTPVNGYAEYNRLNYEPFDILFMTDYPKASKSDAAATILDDMADLCDYRPLFSFKTHMVHKTPSKWAAKGFTTAPVVPKNSRLRLNIVCYAHPMFEDLKTASATNQILHDCDDGSQLVYTMLSGAGYESSKGMQGFEIDAAENFVTIGLVHYNATARDSVPDNTHVTWDPGSGDRMLVAAAERQAVMEARMILFSLNAGAHSKLNTTGENVVLKCLEYLSSNGGVIEPADCSLTFDNNNGSGDGKWSTATNWAPNRLNPPGKYNSARIAAPVTVDVTHAEALELRIIEGGSVTIPAGKALEVTSTIRRMDGHEISPTEVSDLHLSASSTSSGTLIFNNNSGDSKAQVDMYSKGFIDGEGVKNYQYIGTPFNEINALYNYYGSWIYYWKADGSGWKAVKNGGPMTAWTGYCITQESPTYYETSGTLTATGTVDIPVPADANMVVGNSWTAPIDINNFTDDDFENLNGKVYFFNTGVDKNGTGTTTQNATGDTRWAGGTYVSVPIHAASYTGTDDHIPSMQGFFVKNENPSTDGVLHLDYERHVRGTSRDNILSGQLHAPRRGAALNSDEPAVLKMIVSGENYDDKLVLLAREDFTASKDFGWDGDKWDGNESALYLYTMDSEGTENSVSAIPEMEGTIIGFRAGEDDAYTLKFEYLNGDEELYLYDTENNTYTQIMTGATYRFFTSDKEKHARFIITRNSPQTPTDIGNGEASGGARAKKFILNDKMYIMINGLLYDATGKVVK